MQNYQPKIDDNCVKIIYNDKVIHSFYNLLDIDDKLELINCNDNSIMYLIKRHNNFNLTFWIFEHTGDIYEAYNETKKQFSNFIIYNLEKKTLIKIDTGIKCCINSAKFARESNFLILNGSIFGQGCYNLIYNFEGEELYIEDFILEKHSKELYFSEEKSIDIVNNELTFNYIIPKIFFDKDKFPFAPNLVVSKFEETDKFYFLPKYSNKLLISENVESEIDRFLEHCNHYKYVKDIAPIFVKMNNFFKIFSTQNVDNILIERSGDLSMFSQLKVEQIKNIEHNGLYTNNNYINSMIYLINKEFDINDFGFFLARNTLGHDYFSNGSVKKEDIPDGIGLITKFTTIDNSIYTFIIKMSLIEVDDNKERVTYVKEKSKIYISIIRT